MNQRPLAALVRLEPRDALLNLRIVGRQARASQHVDDEAGRVAVAGGHVLRAAVAALPIAQRGQRPAAVGPLQRQQVVEATFAIVAA